MEGTSGSAGQFARWIGNLSLLAAIFACLMLWSGVALLLTHPTHPQASAPSNDTPSLPMPIAQWEGASQARRSLADLLLFWLPIGLGAVACGTGVAVLTWGRGQDRDASRRALIALVLSVVPGCMCTLWYVAFTVPPILGR